MYPQSRLSLRSHPSCLHTNESSTCCVVSSHPCTLPSYTAVLHYITAPASNPATTKGLVKQSDLVLGEQGKVEQDLEGLGVGGHHHELRYPPVEGLRRCTHSTTQKKNHTFNSRNVATPKKKGTEQDQDWTKTRTEEQASICMARHLRWRPS